jgi:hypothetical protein
MTSQRAFVLAGVLLAGLAPAPVPAAAQTGIAA